MALYTLEEIEHKVVNAAREYNKQAPKDEQLVSVSLFGSYAQGKAQSDSDIDLLVSFRSAIVSLFTLAKVLAAMEDALDSPVDIVQDPLPEGSILLIEKRVPLYEQR